MKAAESDCDKFINPFCGDAVHSLFQKRRANSGQDDLLYVADTKLIFGGIFTEGAESRRNLVGGFDFKHPDTASVRP
jgi:hypothetical protein